MLCSYLGHELKACTTLAFLVGGVDQDRGIYLESFLICELALYKRHTFRSGTSGNTRMILDDTLKTIDLRELCCYFRLIRPSLQNALKLPIHLSPVSELLAHHIYYEQGNHPVLQGLRLK